MKKLFTAIRQGDFATVTALLDKKPELIACTAKAPPKKDIGQSPLQVAIKSSNFVIAHLLLDRGADVNFMEAADCGSDWQMPVVQDAVMAAVMTTRWNARWPEGYRVYHTKAQADETYALLERMIRMGADLTRRDSHGRTGLDRALLSARQIIPQFHFSERRYLEDRQLTPELDEDLMRIFNLIVTASPEVSWSHRFIHPQETLLLQYIERCGNPYCYEKEHGLAE